jgi:6-phosphogluconolactonase
MTELRVFPDAEAVARHAADQIAWRIGDARKQGLDVHIALAGGQTPRRAYELLAGIEGSWKHVHLWLGDERCVPAGHPESNARMVRESLYAHARAEPPSLHAVPSPEQPEDAAWLYGLDVRQAVPERTFDIVLLGMGPDGHTASLFPNHPVLDAHGVAAGITDSPKPPPERITLTLTKLNESRRIVLMVTGEGKSEALARVMAGPDRTYPASLLDRSKLLVMADNAALPG